MEAVLQPQDSLHSLILCSLAQLAIFQPVPHLLALFSHDYEGGWDETFPER